MSEKEETCRQCEEGEVRKIISDFTSNSNTAPEQKKEVGSEVKKYIETAKKEIKEE